ncbi:MAG: rod shape-determining protein MreC [Deinococcus sp.]|nr:rod shape-determining protein MreC [Deinococcus sp.]
MTPRLLQHLLFAALLVLGLALASLTRQLAPWLPGEFSARVAPLFGMSYRFGHNLRAALASLSDRRDLRAENRALREELGSLRQENSRLLLEVRKLSGALEVRASRSPGLIAIAPVVDEDPSGLYRRLTIGQGSNDGLRAGMPVTSPTGLVGLVTEVAPQSATVRTLLDPESRVGVRLRDKPGRGVAYGQPPGLLRVEFAPEAQVAEGDLVVSGSLQGLFPEGLTVGVVIRILPKRPGALKQAVLVKPSASFSLLEQVVVLRPL